MTGEPHSTLFTARALRSNLARLVMEKRQHCYLMVTERSWREKSVGIYPKPSKADGYGHETHHDDRQLIGML